MNDLTLAEALRRGEEAAIGHAIDKYSRLLWRVCQGVLAPLAADEDIEECVADTFVYLWQNPGKYDPQRGSLKSWLVVVARSRAADRFRQLARKSTLSLDDARLADTLSLTDELLLREDRAALCQAVNALREQDREILLRRYACEQMPRQIARAMDMPVKQVENRLYRIKQRLRQELR